MGAELLHLQESNRTLQLEVLNRTIKLLAEHDSLFVGIDWGYRPPSPFEQKAQRVRYLIDVGKPDEAQGVARELATEALEQMGRTICPTTGFPYFDEGCDCY